MFRYFLVGIGILLTLPFISPSVADSGSTNQAPATPHVKAQNPSEAKEKKSPFTLKRMIQTLNIGLIAHQVHSLGVSQVCGIVSGSANAVMNPYWAPHSVDAHGMNHLVNHIFTHARNTTGIPKAVEVIDKHFDHNSFKHFGINKPSLQHFKGDENRTHILEYFPQTSTPDGHGNAVASMISGHGVGVVDPNTVSLHLYESDGLHHMRKIEAICRHTSENNKNSVSIINSSWAREGHYLDEVSEPHFIEKLAKSGCLLVKSAGNWAELLDRTKMDSHDALLRIESSNYRNGIAAHSNSGEVRAPGEQVMVLNRNGLLPCGTKFDPTMKCNFATGTSFAAPIVSGVASQVVRILDSTSYFAKMSPPDRVTLVSKIIHESHLAGVVNGKKAIELAEHWNRASTNQKSPAPKDLRGISRGPLTF